LVLKAEAEPTEVKRGEAGGLRRQWGLAIVAGGGVLDRGWGGMVPDRYSTESETVGLRAMKKIGLLKRLARKKGGLKYDPYGFQLIEWP